MDQPPPADREFRGQGPDDSFPASLEANEADVQDPGSWTETDDTAEGPLPAEGLEADEADLAEQARAVPDDDEDGHDRDRGPGY
ncbi:hypothetical protein [Arthrobacter sp.]|uniref:hypothetical protein n=1 Tax=Arthrobacter sp. TaxID=1667 RepID=UPI003A8FF8F2